MSQFKSQFKDSEYFGTNCNIQSCLRLNDINEVGDNTHLLYFDMLGLFSFRQMNVSESIDFWMEFLNTLNLKPDYVTIHSDKYDWVKYYDKYNVEVKVDNECIWGDGDLNGYCTEFYINNIEIGNIVNISGSCIDCGFGKERLELIINNEVKSEKDIFIDTIFKLIESDIQPSNTKQGYILRKLIRICYSKGIMIDHPFYKDEIIRQNKITERYNKLKNKHINKSKEWWWETFGIDLDIL